MQRFRILDVYLACILLLLILVIAGMAWFKRPEVAAARAVAEWPTTNVEPARPAEGPARAAAHAANQVNVAIENFAFAPKDLSVAVGTTVTWVNRDDVPHTTTSNAGPEKFDSKALDTDDKYSFTFTKPGTYTYYCKAHPHMTASIVVN